MADKKFKTGVDLQSTVKISSETSERAMVLDASGNLVSSATTDTEIGYVSGLTSSAQTQLTSAQGDATQALSDAGDAQTTADDAIPATEKGANSGVATLDGSGKLSSGQVPAIAITSTYVVATEIAQLALTVQEGDVAVRTDESQSYIALNADNADMGDWQLLLTPTDAVQSVNGETGVVVLDSDHISDSGKTNKFVVAGDITKLGHISVTQAVDLDTIESDTATNNAKVSADGLVTTHSDVTSAGSGAIITSGERTDLGTALQPADASTQLNHTQTTTGDWTVADEASVGAHLDEVGGRLETLESATGGNLSAGDITETSFSGAADTATTLDVTGLAFANGTVRSFDAHISVVIDAAADLYETFRLSGIQKAAGWDMSVEATGDDSLVSFTITSAGQVQYSKTTTATWVSTTIKFRADTLGV